MKQDMHFDSRSHLPSLIHQLQPKRVLVVGDLLLDTYTSGEVQRISPEAPVPVMRVMRTESLPGGAGNVARNLLSLGNSVFLLSRIGELDPAGEAVLNTLQKSSQHCFTKGVFQQKQYYTPEKNRLISQSQQLLRIDREEITPVPHDLILKVRAYLASLSGEIDIIAVSDYGKGFISAELMQELYIFSQDNSLKIIVDPKNNDFAHYTGAYLIKPNQLEAQRAASLTPHANLSDVAKCIFERAPFLKHLMVTRAKDGLSLFSSKPRAMQHYTIAPQEVVDVTGAGDCVLATIVFALACDLNLDDTCRLANVAGTLAVRRLGCVTLDLGDVAHEMLKCHQTTKILSEKGHLFALRQISQSKQLALITTENVPSKLALSFITHLKTLLEKIPDSTTLLYIPNSQSTEFHEFLEVISLLENLDFILLKESEGIENKKHLEARIAPKVRFHWTRDGFVQACSMSNTDLFIEQVI